MPKPDHLLLLVAMLGSAMMPQSSLAFSNGFSGRSGREGTICTECHKGGTEPLVHFEGPQELAAGAIATFKFVIQSQSASQTFAGFDVAPSGGSVGVVDGQDEQQFGDDVTHIRPMQNDANGIASFDLTFTAPLCPGLQTLFGAGNSGNHNGLDTGDNAAAATYAVSVTGAACRGDCSGDGEVTIEDLVRAVDAAAGVTGVDQCAGANFNGDGQIDLSEIETAINSALGGGNQP